ncbi:alpha/beta-hydrolase [Paraphaeosphaeria sporulosa]|uniref:Alpha/beta-hydrolase n=1 Tax=Paraphaeosphaeria sporulosa TaxID=1460663 RepID=A0A177C696_9PLEO|nr:alpha/beta-hydrolase [Paraphaeosphaeria sporulosa]OAG02257.1 alpha/beta-hydrolase [Paraphaeosphaeria sporulosa]
MAIHTGMHPSLILKAIPGAGIRYEKTIACGSVVSYSSYVRMIDTVVPGAAYNTSTFFWFFPALNHTGANLALYLAGGPGEASSFAALTENGPCISSKDGNPVIPNPFPFNQTAHVLYVDQPNQIGLSYDRIVVGVFDALGGFAGWGDGRPHEEGQRRPGTSFEPRHAHGPGLRRPRLATQL